MAPTGPWVGQPSRTYQTLERLLLLLLSSTLLRVQDQGGDGLNI